MDIFPKTVICDSLLEYLSLNNSGCGLYAHRPEQAIVMQPEVLSADQWEHFMENNLGRSTGSGWIGSLLSSSQQPAPVLTEADQKQLHYILSTAPTWDR